MPPEDEAPARRRVSLSGAEPPRRAPQVTQQGGAGAGLAPPPGRALRKGLGTQARTEVSARRSHSARDAEERSSPEAQDVETKDFLEGKTYFRCLNKAK